MPTPSPILDGLPVSELLDAAEFEPPRGTPLGRSREGRPVIGHRFGSGPTRISLIAGAHADEPVGPLLLTRLTALLDSLDPDHPAQTQFSWWIVPHLNPDGAARNEEWQREILSGESDAADLGRFLERVERAVPGEDLEFGFPRNGRDLGAAPETRAVCEWWRTDPTTGWAGHVSLHGMAFASGPWFLLEADAVERTRSLRDRVRQRVRELGYTPRDVDRGGEKGFHRIDPGFSTRPRSDAMQLYFRERGDDRTAGLFRPNSMETIRGFNDASRGAITAVTECPLFLRDEASAIEIPDERNATESERASRPERAQKTTDLLRTSGVRPMPIADQLDLMWTFVAGVIDVAAEPDADGEQRVE